MRLKVSTSVGPPEIGQWYARGEKGQEFRVVGRDEESRTIEIQTFDGELDEIEAETWGTLPLERIEAPEDSTAPLDDVETDDLGYSETDMTTGDWAQPLQPVAMAAEAWEAPEPEEDRDALGVAGPREQHARRDGAALPGVEAGADAEETGRGKIRVLEHDRGRAAAGNARQSHAACLVAIVAAVVDVVGAV